MNSTTKNRNRFIRKVPENPYYSSPGKDKVITSLIAAFVFLQKK